MRLNERCVFSAYSINNRIFRVLERCFSASLYPAERCLIKQFTTAAETCPEGFQLLDAGNGLGFECDRSCLFEQATRTGVHGDEQLLDVLQHNSLLCVRYQIPSWHGCKHQYSPLCVNWIQTPKTRVPKAGLAA
jgi:hypothetical protein